MRRLKRLIWLVFVLACAGCAGYIVKSRMVEDHTPPVITCGEDTISISVEDDESALLEGVKAEDNRDGDLTDSVRVASMSHFINGKRTVTYAVFDKANQLGTLERTVEYTDYTSPKIHMSSPLRFGTSELDDVNLSESLTAEDCLDGDLTSQIRTIVDNGYYGMQTGACTVTLQVSNSAGDVCSVPVEMTIVDSQDREERDKEYPLLSEYIVYTSVNQAIDPGAYLKGIERNGTEYTYESDGEMLAGTQEAIGITSNVDYATPGVYTVEYSYTAEGAATAVTKLYVVVEGEQDEQSGES